MAKPSTIKARPVQIAMLIVMFMVFPFLPGKAGLVRFGCRSIPHVVFVLGFLAEQPFLAGRHNRPNQQSTCCPYRKLHLDGIEVDNLAGFGIHFRRNRVALALGNVPFEPPTREPGGETYRSPIPES